MSNNIFAKPSFLEKSNVKFTEVVHLLPSSEREIGKQHLITIKL